MRRSLLPALALILAVLVAILIAAPGLREEPVDAGISAPSISQPRLPSVGAAGVIADLPDAEAARAPSVVDASALGVPSGPGSIDVRVLRDEDRAPLEGALVEIRSAGESQRSASAKTDADGRARFQDLATGSWTVHVGAEGRADDRDSVRISSTKKNADAAFRLAFERTVIVRVADSSGLPLARADFAVGDQHWHELAVVLDRSCGAIGATFEPRGPPRSRATRYEDRDGSVLWRVTVQGRDPACVHAVLRDTVIAAKELDLQATELLLLVSRAATSAALSETCVRVIDANSALPLAGARVVLGREGRSFERTTDGDGRASFGERIDSGSTITVSAPGFATATQAFSRTKSRESLVRLVPGRRIEGVIVRPDGVPLRNAPVELRALAANGRDVDRSVLRSLKSSNEGRYVFDGLAVGVYVVGHAASGVRWPVEADEIPAGFERVDCRGGDVIDLELPEIRVPWSDRPSSAPSTYTRPRH